jgi:hypothetical protein
VAEGDGAQLGGHVSAAGAARRAEEEEARERERAAGLRSDTPARLGLKNS